MSQAAYHTDSSTEESFHINSPCLLPDWEVEVELQARSVSSFLGVKPPNIFKETSGR